jgi:hypothetical protein
MRNRVYDDAHETGLPGNPSQGREKIPRLGTPTVRHGPPEHHRYPRELHFVGIGAAQSSLIPKIPTLGPSEQILRFASSTHPGTRSLSYHRNRRLSAIYGPCGVMACTLGIFYHLKAYIQGRSSNLRRTVPSFLLLRTPTVAATSWGFFGV